MRANACPRDHRPVVDQMRRRRTPCHQPLYHACLYRASHTLVEARNARKKNATGASCFAPRNARRAVYSAPLTDALRVLAMVTSRSRPDSLAN